jgi:hypothetical protein
MNDFNFAGMNLEKENQFSAPFNKWMKAEFVFHFFHFFSTLFPIFQNGKKYLPIEVREIFLISRD